MKLLIIENFGDINVLIACPLCGKYVQYVIGEMPHELELRCELILHRCLQENEESHDVSTKANHMTAIDWIEINKGM